MALNGDNGAVILSREEYEAVQDLLDQVPIMRDNSPLMEMYYYPEMFAL